MTTTSAIPPINASASNSSSASSMQLSQADFLKLITAQMQNQNPLSPSDPTQYLSQMEQLSEVSSMQSMQTALQRSQTTNGANLLGKSVLAPGSTATLSSGGTVTGAVNAPSGATGLTVTVKNSKGATVDSFTVTPASGGITAFSWDGTTSTGGTAAAGTYTLSVSAKVNGTSTDVDPMVVSQVQSVSIDSSTQALELNTNNGTVALSDVNTIL